MDCFVRNKQNELGWRKPMPTPSMEDYIEQIYLLIDEKGYARVS
ncbi:transcriptional regulator MntR, partial [Bacillus sp. HC-Mk]